MSFRQQDGIPFFKMSGAGNDFIVFDLFDSEVGRALEEYQGERSEFVAKICKRGLSVGADGAVFLMPDKKFNFAWDFFNSDGSTAEMCGNAARCVVSYLFQAGRVPTEVEFQTRAGLVRGRFNPDRTVSIWMPGSDFQIQDFQEGALVNTGVPHLVVSVSENQFSSEEWKERARAWRSDSRFGSRGTNVTFIWNVGSSRVQSVSFERGVEDFTLACGTGAVAAALVTARNHHRDLGTEPLIVQVPGGDLSVSWDFQRKRPILTGPAQIIYIGALNPGAMK